MAIQSLNTSNIPSQRVPFVYIANASKWESEKPYYISGPLAPQQEHLRTNLEYERDEQTVYDLREIKTNTPTIENDGFELVSYNCPVSVSLDTGEKDQTADYLVATSEWLQNRFGADRVLCYAYRVCTIMCTRYCLIIERG